MSRVVRPVAASVARQSSLEPASAQRLDGFGLDQRVVIQRPSRSTSPPESARRCSHRRNHQGAARHEFAGMGNEALKPGQLVIEFRSRLRIPIGEGDPTSQDSLNSRFDVPSLVIFRISRQARARQNGGVVSRENGYAVPGRSPCQTASYPTFRRASTGKAFCSALSS